MRLIIFILCSILSLPSFSNIDQQRRQFFEAEKAIKLGQKGQVKVLKSKLIDYPLYIYLEYKELKRRLPFLKNKQVRDFMDKYPNTPSANYLRRAWLTLLSKRGHWKRYLDFYDANDASIVAQCNYHKALIKTGNKQQSFNRIDSLWLHGKSRPSQCNFAFNAWKASGLRTTDKVWQRFELAIKKGQTSLATYLMGQLPVKERVWAKRWMMVHKSPKVVLQKQPFAQPHAKRMNILLHGIYRLSRKSPQKSLKAWTVLNKRYDFSEAESQQAIAIIGGSHIRHKSPDTLAYLDQLDFTHAEFTLQERSIREALRAQDWSRVNRWVQQLSSENQAKEPYRYWLARSFEMLGDQKVADDLYRLLAKERSYYGYLAADQLNIPYVFNDFPLDLAADLMQRMENHQAILRMKELRAITRFTDARREWYYLNGLLDNDEKMAFSKIMQSWGWHDRAIFTLAKTGYWDDLTLRFPIKYQDYVSKHAEDRNLEMPWVYAVMRQESAFNRDARSPVGALGLMQLMPATARHVARQLKVKRPRKKDILLPKNNINFGTSYLREVLNELGQSPVLATAAYNAGPHRVKKWLPNKIMPSDVWVALIPFTETRRYVERVMMYTAVYQHRLGLKVSRLSKRMGSIQTRKGIRK